MAQSVAYTDPAAGGTAGSHFATVLSNGSASRTRLPASAISRPTVSIVMRKIKSGEVELGITQVSEILLVDRATDVGPCRKALQQPTIYAVFIPATADSVDPRVR